MTAFPFKPGTATDLTDVNRALRRNIVSARAYRQPVELAAERLSFVGGTAERLPVGDGAYDLVVSTTSFDHWADQAVGVRE